MKKLILSAAAILAFSFAQAQDSGIRFGAIAGGNLSTITKSSIATNLFGYHVGGFIEYTFDERWAFQPEVMYSTQGSKADVNDYGSNKTFTMTMNLNYINVPLTAKYYANEKFNIQVGPQIGFLTSAKLKSMDEEKDIKSTTQSTTFGLNFGAGYDFTENLFAQFRYNMGLNDIAKDSQTHSKNSVFQLSLGYKF